MNHPEITIVTLNWNQAEETLQCLSSATLLQYPNYRVLVVDNGSSDGSDRRIQKECPWVTLIRNDKNLGFAEGCNVGIRKALEAQTPYLLFLNNDAKMDSHCLTYLVEGIEKDSKRGIVGAINYLPEMPDVPWTCGHRFIWWRGALKRILPPQGLSSSVFEIQSVSGSCFLVRRELFEAIGLFDPRFFIYYEETDFCLRAAKAGFKVLVHRDARVWHKGSNTFGQRSAAEYYLFARNHALCLVRHCPGGLLPSALLLYFLKLCYQSLLLLATGRLKEVSAVWAGLLDFGMRRFGEGRLARFSSKGV